MTLEDYTEGFRAALMAAEPLPATLVMQVGSLGAIRLDGRTVSNSNEPASCTLEADEDTYGRIFAGDLDPSIAFAQGKLEIQGDLGPALKLAPLMALARARA